MKQIFAAHNQQKQFRSDELHKFKNENLDVKSELLLSVKDLNKNFMSLSKTAQSKADLHLTQLLKSFILNCEIYVLNFINDLSF